MQKLTQTRLYALVIGLLFFVTRVGGQTFTSQVINLPGSFNRDLLNATRDSDGFIWFTNNEGLWRFDGTDVKLFNYRKLKLQQNAAATNLYCYRQFIFFNAGAVMRVYNRVTGQCNVYDLGDSPFNIDTTNPAKLFCITNNGQAWKFSADYGLQKAFNVAMFDGWQKGMMVQHTLVDSNGTVYVCVRDRVGILQGKSIMWGPALKVAPGKTKYPFITVYSAALTSQYLGVQYYNGQVIIYDKHTLQPLYNNFGNAVAYCFTINNSLVFIPHDSISAAGLPKSPLFTLTRCLSPDFLGVKSLVYTAANNNVLAATGAGLIQLTPQYGQNNTLTDNSKILSFFHNKSVRSVCRINKVLYVGTYNGFFACTPDSIHKITTLDIYTIKPLNDSMLICSIEGGVGIGFYNINTKQFTLISKQEPVNTIYVYALYKYGKEWLAGAGNQLKLLQEQNGKWVLRNLLFDSVLGIVRDIKRINNTTYIACQSGVFILNPGNKLKKIYPEQGALRVYTMLDEGDGIWLGTHGEGLVKIDYKGNVLQQMGFNEGLANNFVYSLVKMQNLVVAGTGSGVSVFNNNGNVMQPLPVVRNDRLYGVTDGECNHSAFFYDSVTQQVILGGVNGLVFVNYSNYSNNSSNQNKLILSYLKTGSYETNSAEANLFASQESKIILQPEDKNITLKFAAPNITGPTDGLFRISGFDNEWQRISTGQEVNLYALPPGTYLLQARLPTAVNESEWFSKTIVVTPTFYQTIWFKLLVGAGCLSIIYLIWHSKVKKIERELQLRAMIASDLHDDIGSTLNSISVYTEVATQQLQRDAIRTKSLLDNMGVASRGMIDRMNDIVWAINPKNDDFENVLERMRFFAGELLSGKNMLLEFEVDEKVIKARFSMQERKNIYLIYKEAVNNAYKYSGGTTVRVQIQKEGYNFTMAIEDNGDGFKSDGKNGGGNGLANMKNRAKEIGGRLNITSSAETGTTVQLILRKL
ncbi:MAG TPA: ATP-binding protein [Chitinophagaceae bacterium]|nr:ATP-binding protein [Chitinophagaceae bacterium]